MQTTLKTSPEAPRQDAETTKNPKCKLCLKPYTRRKENQLFCCDNHRKEFHAYGKLSPDRIALKILPTIKREVKRIVAEELSKHFAQKMAS